jgi:hypothetical protein
MTNYSNTTINRQNNLPEYFSKVALCSDKVALYFDKLAEYFEELSLNFLIEVKPSFLLCHRWCLVLGYNFLFRMCSNLIGSDLP